MRYLITTKETYSPFLTEWFEPENHFNADLDMIVYDLVENKYTTDGNKWHEIEVDLIGLQNECKNKKMRSDGRNKFL